MSSSVIRPAHDFIRSTCTKQALVIDKRTARRTIGTTSERGEIDYKYLVMYDVKRLRTSSKYVK